MIGRADLGRGQGEDGVGPIDGADVRDLARHWRKALSDTSFVPRAADEVEDLFGRWIRRLASALDGESFDPETGSEIGIGLVELGYSAPVVVTRSAAVLNRLPTLLHRLPEYTYRTRLAELIGGLGTGYADALRERTLAEQEAIMRGIAEARHATAEALQASEKRFRVIFDNAPAAIAVGDVFGRIIDANAALCTMLRLPVERLLGTAVLDYLHPDDLPDVQEMIYRDLVTSGTGTVRFEKRFRTADGEWLWGALAVTFVTGIGDGQDYLLAIGEDVTERRRVQSALHHQARHDPLTGLPNRLLLAEEFAAVRERTATELVGLCLLDLDGFKQVNDRNGHGVGDRLLIAVAERLRERAGCPGRLLVRLGGDEFVVLITPPTTTPDVIATAHALITALAEPIPLDDEAIAVSGSVGVTVRRADSGDLDTLIAAADRGLYRAKSRRRGTWTLDTDPITTTERRVSP